MFSAEALRRAAEKWRTILARVPFARSIDLRIQAVENADEREALRILYASSPLSDWGNYDFSIFQSTAAHAVFLKKTSALPEEIFISYVLPLRVNEEALSDCRAFSIRSSPRGFRISRPSAPCSKSTTGAPKT